MSIGGTRSKAVLEFAALTVVAALLHSLITAVVFPGFYDPLWPWHSDQYAYTSMAFLPHAPQSLAFYPRPLGFLFFWLVGGLGTRGVIAASLVVVFANVALTAMLMRHLTDSKVTIAYACAAIAYTFLVFAHPGQYVWSAYDVLSQLSYLFLILGLHLALSGAPAAVLIVVFGAGFLVKETHLISLLALLAAWWAVGDRRSAIRSGICLVAGFAVSVVYNKALGSTFLGGGATPDSDYWIVATPGSVLREWSTYALDGLSWPAWGFLAALIVAIALIAPAPKRATLLALGSVAAGCLVWLPNSLLPNHHFAGYAWNGAYLLFAPTLILGASITSGVRGMSVGLAGAVCALLLPLTFSDLYGKNAWVLDQQQHQKHMMTVIAEKLRTLSPSTRNVLISGISQFNPFDFPWALLEYRRALPAFTVIQYPTWSPPRHTEDTAALRVRYATPDEAAGASFDEVWAFAEDGALVSTTISTSDVEGLRKLGLPPEELAIFPNVAAALRADKSQPEGALALDGYHLLSCGIAYIGYGRYASALKCLAASRDMIPENPYPHYFMGQSLEKLGRIAEAVASYKQAVECDDPKSRNPAFQGSLDRVSAKL